MNKKIFIPTGILLLMILFSFSPTETISYKDLNTKYTITGPLNMPMGKVFEMEANKVNPNTKSNDPTFEVVKVNGVDLEKPVIMSYRTLLIDDKFELGKKYKCKAYQDGSFTGTPSEVLQEEMIQTQAYHFTVGLVVFKVL
jgi:hypothetical protein